MMNWPLYFSDGNIDQTLQSSATPHVHSGDCIWLLSKSDCVSWKCLIQQMNRCAPDVESLPARKHNWDRHGVYTRYIGERKFRLGTHLPTAERRFGTISHLFQIMKNVTGDSRWTPFARVLADQIAAGKLTISITKANYSTQDNDSKGGAA